MSWPQVVLAIINMVFIIGAQTKDERVNVAVLTVALQTLLLFGGWYQ